MSKKSRGSSGQQRQQGTKEDEGSRGPSRSSKAVAAAVEQSNSAVAFSPASGKHSSAPGDILSKRIRTMRKRLQRAEASEKKKAAGDKISAEQESAVAGIPILRAVIKELEDLASSTESDIDVSKDDTVADDETCVQIVNGESLVLQQTLQLVYAVTDKLPRITAAYVSDYERSQLSEFYRLIFTHMTDDAKTVDEKFDQPSNAAINHMRSLTERSPRPVDGMAPAPDSSEKTSYSDIATIIDCVFSAPASGAGLVASPIECQCVKMPKLSSIFVETETDLQDPDDDFNMKVDVPPGGFTFIASAAMVEGSDDEDDEATQQKDTEGAASMAMPQPTHADEPTDADGASAAKDVGGFAHPIKGPSLEAASTSRPEPTPASLADGVTMVMPVPADDSTRDVEVSAVPDGVFTPYGVSAQAAPAMPRWSPVSGLPATTAAIPGGMYGGMPMPFPPHMAMQYGYAPPHMYGMQSISPVGGAVVAPPGMGSAGSEAKPGSVPPRDSSVSGVGEPQKQQLQQQQQIGEEMWISGNGSEAVSRLSTHTPTAAVPGFQNMSVTPPVIGSMGGIDPYQQAMAAAAAAAAAGYGMNSPFMYPHIDASNLSTAATGGGSENNESVHSIDSASNRGAGSRPNSMYYPQVAPPAADGQRGFNQAMAGNEYHQMAAAPYQWAQQSEPHQFIKNVQAGVYAGYPYQGQGQGQGMTAGQQQQSQQQQPQPQPSQNTQQSYHQGQGYRRRGSGSNNGSNSGGGGGHQHGQYQRDRRGHNNNNNSGGYSQQHRQQRWNNNNNNNNNSSNGGGGQHGYNQHHRQNNNSRDVSQHHSQDTASNFGGSDGSGYYPRQQ
ncbi:hypothetical protein LPJ53_004753 [Coemansia erecta]|uniref:Uncharacterized protein n=1 Tax=Coemansia erecta TaxID=147472 RepID=A0A9W7XZ40_9FUNG|nr:hypothetical protein LPJ53_004753 [Coemansia erecta]